MNKIASKKIKRKIIFLICIFTALILFADFNFRPMIKSISASRSRMIASEIVNEAIFEDMQLNKQSYETMMSVEKNCQGEVLAICSDISRVNLLKSHISLLISKKFDNFKGKRISIPLGTLTGCEILNGKGPGVPLKIAVSGSVETELKSNFASSGINQTLHQIYVLVHTRISVMLPGCSCVTEFKTNVLVSETVIVGKVPKFYSSGAMREMCSVANPESAEIKSGS